MVSDSSKSIDDAIIGVILETLGNNISYFPNLTNVAICSSDLKPTNTPTDNGYMSAKGSAFGPPTEQIRQSIFCGALCLLANSGPRLEISIIIPEKHRNNIPILDYAKVARENDPDYLSRILMMEVDGAYHEQLRKQKGIERDIRNLFLGMFRQGVIQSDGTVSEIWTSGNASQYKIALKDKKTSLTSLVVKIQP